MKQRALQKKTDDAATAAVTKQQWAEMKALGLSRAEENDYWGCIKMGKTRWEQMKAKKKEDAKAKRDLEAARELRRTHPQFPEWNLDDPPPASLAGYVDWLRKREGATSTPFDEGATLCTDTQDDDVAEHAQQATNDEASKLCTESDDDCSAWDSLVRARQQLDEAAKLCTDTKDDDDVAEPAQKATNDEGAKRCTDTEDDDDVAEPAQKKAKSDEGAKLCTDTEDDDVAMPAQKATNDEGAKLCIDIDDDDDDVAMPAQKAKSDEDDDESHDAVSEVSYSIDHQGVDA